jgi:GNAT superfamily N-acetyltransferase
VKAFLTEFVATQERTAAWLASTVGPDSGRILFLLRDDRGAAFGACGLAFIDWTAGSFELDGVTRGSEVAPGGMSAGLRTLIGWAAGQLGLRLPLVRVLADNEHALEFYRRLGFNETYRLPLRRVEESGLVRWEVDSADDAGYRQLVYMRMEPATPGIHRPDLDDHNSKDG